VLPARAVEAVEAHAVGVEERLDRGAVEDRRAVGRVARRAQPGLVVGQEVRRRPALERHDEEPVAQAVRRLVLERRDERELAPVGREVVLAREVHPVEVQRRVRRQVAQRLRREVEVEEVRHLARREPGVPVAEDAVLGDVRLHRVLLAARELRLRRLGREVALEKHRAEDQARAVGQPRGVEDAERQVRHLLGLAARERHDEELPLLPVLAHEGEARAVGRERRLPGVERGRGQRHRLAAVAGDEPDAPASLVLLHVERRHHDGDAPSVGRGHRRADARDLPQVRGGEVARALARGMDGRLGPRAVGHGAHGTQTGEGRGSIPPWPASSATREGGPGVEAVDRGPPEDRSCAAPGS
jgi:hypothetical protein